MYKSGPVYASDGKEALVVCIRLYLACILLKFQGPVQALPPSGRRVGHIAYFLLSASVALTAVSLHLCTVLGSCLNWSYLPNRDIQLLDSGEHILKISVSLYGA